MSKMGVKKYVAKGRTYWMVDETLALPDGRVVRFRRRIIPTREMAMALAAKVKADAFEGKHFERTKPSTFTVKEAWDLYEPIVTRDHGSVAAEKSAAKHLVRLLGDKRAAHLSVGEIDTYRATRFDERSVRGTPPAPATLDREVELLQRMLGYAVKSNKLRSNPLAGVGLLRRPNVRRTVVTEEMFARLHDAADLLLKPILLVAFDTGMRKGEILQLRWPQFHGRERCIRLEAADTKTEEARVVHLTTRTFEVLDELPRDIRSDYVFVNPETGTAWKDVRKMFTRACKDAGLTGLWFHDLRRSFVTKGRRAGIAESVVMKMSGHKTRSVFDRYNIVDDEDVRAAVGMIEAASLRQSCDKVGGASA